MDQSMTMNTLQDWRKRGYHMRTPPLILISYDPAGDGDDNDAYTVVCREEHQRGEPWDPDFAIMTRFRMVYGAYMPMGLEFAEKEALVLGTYKKLYNEWVPIGRASGVILIVESNGIGYAMTSQLRSKLSSRVLPYTTVGSRGDSAFGEKGLIMPRLSALSMLKVRMEQHVVKVPNGCHGKNQLIKEINSFVWAAPGRPEALQGQKDDMVMSLCGAVWIGEKAIGPLLKQKKYGKAA